jgi:hypothetical protein
LPNDESRKLDVVDIEKRTQKTDLATAD